MSKPIEVASAEQFNDLLKKSRVVVADCKSLPWSILFPPKYPAIVTGRRPGAGLGCRLLVCIPRN